MKKLPGSIELTTVGLERAYGNPIKPLRLVLQCPQCGKQHVDVGEFATRVHHVHRCVDKVPTLPCLDGCGGVLAHSLVCDKMKTEGFVGCGFEWQPALIPTVGVETLE